MVHRMTRQQMAEKYPDTWLGLKNMKYKDDDGVTLLSADVVYTDKTRDELLEMQIDGIEGIIGWYTTENSLCMGLVGVCNAANIKA